MGLQVIDGKVVGELEERGSKSPCCRRVDRAGGGGGGDRGGQTFNSRGFNSYGETHF